MIEVKQRGRSEAPADHPPPHHARNLRWPADRFYWSIVSAPGVRAHGLLPIGLLPSLEHDLPVPTDSVHAVAAPTSPTSDDRLLVCAIEKQLLEGLPTDVITLVPESVPLFAGDFDGDLNLLVGDFTPAPLRRESVRRSAAIAASILLATIFLARGLQRWTTALESSAATASQRGSERLKSVIPSGDPAEARRELASLRASRGAAPSLADASLVLSDLLGAWKPAKGIEVDHLSINQDTLAISVTLGANSPDEVARTLPALPNLKLAEPRFAGEHMAIEYAHQKPAP